MLLQTNVGSTVRNNRILSLAAGINTIGIGTYNSQGSVIENNSLVGPFVCGEDVPVTSFGIMTAALNPAGDFDFYSIVSNNEVTSYSVGYIDSDPFYGSGNSIGTVFQDNIASGNEINYELTSASTVSDGNIESACPP